MSNEKYSAEDRKRTDASRAVIYIPYDAHNGEADLADRILCKITPFYGTPRNFEALNSILDVTEERTIIASSKMKYRRTGIGEDTTSLLVRHLNDKTKLVYLAANEEEGARFRQHVPRAYGHSVKIVQKHSDFYSEESFRKALFE